VVVDVPAPEVVFRQAPPAAVTAPAPTVTCGHHCLFNHHAAPTYYVQPATQTFITTMAAPAVTVPTAVSYAAPAVSYAAPAASYALTPVAAPVASAPVGLVAAPPAVAVAAALPPPPAVATVPLVAVLPVAGVPAVGVGPGQAPPCGGLPPPSQAIGSCGSNMDLRTALGVIRDAAAALQASQGGNTNTSRAESYQDGADADLARQVELLNQRVNALTKLVRAHQEQLKTLTKANGR
jgi:hypothetical protein